MEEGRSAFKILVGKPTGKRLWEGLNIENIRIYLKEIDVNTRN